MPVNLTTRAKDVKVKHPLESILFGVDFTLLLAAGETLTGTPTVTGQTNVTAPSPVVNTSTFLNDAGVAVAIGAGVQVRIAGGVDQVDESLTVTCGTSAGNTRAVICVLELRAS